MANQIVVPALGESITEATVSKWLKQVGETVDTDEPLVELETDKVNVEVPSPLSGTLSSIKVKEGDTVEVGSLLGIIKEGKSTSAKTVATQPKSIEERSNILPKKNKKQVTQKIKKEIPEEKTLTLSNKEIDKNSNGTLVLETLAEVVAEKPREEKYLPPKTRKNLSPAVRKIVEENELDISTLEGTGKDRRVTKGDLLNLMGNIPQPSTRSSTHGPEERVKMSRLRLTIAKRLKEAQDSAAMLTTFNEVDMFNISEMRKNYQEDFQKKYSVKL